MIVTMKPALLLTVMLGLFTACLGGHTHGGRASFKRDHSRLDRMPHYGKRSSGHRQPFTGGFGTRDKRFDTLNRMPVTFGKSDKELDAELGNGGDIYELDIKRMAVLLRMPVSFGKRLQIGPRTESENISEDLTQGKRAPGVLDRMPFSYGKRELAPKPADAENATDSMVGNNQDKRVALVDRMPLGYGKRDLVPNDNNTVESKRSGKLNRMPVSFGKRVVRESPIMENLSDMNEEKRKLDRMPFAYGKREDYVMVPADTENTGDYDVDKRLAKLDRMPFAYGKREDYVMVPTDTENTDDYDVDKRLAKLDRMPFAYGKREDATNFGYLQETENSDLEKRLAKLDRMPFSYGKRGMSEAYLRKRLGKLDRMPFSYGKRSELADPAQTPESHDGDVKRHAKLDRMPFAYGKRDVLVDAAETQDVHEAGHILDKRRVYRHPHAGHLGDSSEVKRVGKLERMPVTYGKRGTSVESADAGEIDFDDLDRRLAKLDRMPLNFGKRIVQDDSSEVKRLVKLDRMPLNFRKRNDMTNLPNEESTTEDLKQLNPTYVHFNSRRDIEKEENIPVQEPRAPRFPLRFGKRWVVHRAREKRQSLLHRMPTSFGKRDLTPLWYNVRFSNKRLARLDGMPVNFGKRSHSAENYVPVDDGKLEGKLDRMPMSFGKRWRDPRIQALQERLLSVLNIMRPALGRKQDNSFAPRPIYSGADFADYRRQNQNTDPAFSRQWAELPQD